MAGRSRVSKNAQEPVAPENKVHAKVPKEEVRRRQLSLMRTAKKVLETATSWSKAQGTLSRVLWAESKGERAQAKEGPGQGERETARKLLLLASQESAQKAL